MLESLNNVKNVFKLKEIRQKLLYTLLMMIVIRFGSQLTSATGLPHRRVMRSALWMHLPADPS